MGITKWKWVILGILGFFFIFFNIFLNDTGESIEPHNLRDGGSTAVKIWCPLIIFVLTFAGGIFPYFFNEKFLTMGTQFARGVFTSTTVTHFSNDAHHTFQQLTEKQYPFAFRLCSAGYLITMLGYWLTFWVTFFANGDRKGMTASGDSKTASAEGKKRWQWLSSKAVKVGNNVLLMVALCMHSVFEGIALGVTKRRRDVCKVLCTVELQKLFAAIAMGIALLRMAPNRPFLSCAAYAFAFAISSPVGVGIGTAIDATTQGNVADWVYAISMGVSMWAFIYVAINYLLAKNYAPHHGNGNEGVVALEVTVTLVAVIVGVMVISGVMIQNT